MLELPVVTGINLCLFLLAVGAVMRYGYFIILTKHRRGNMMVRRLDIWMNEYLSAIVAFCFEIAGQSIDIHLHHVSLKVRDPFRQHYLSRFGVQSSIGIQQCS